VHLSVAVVRLSPDRLSRQVWGFECHDRHYDVPSRWLALRRWRREARPTTRHRVWRRVGEGCSARAENTHHNRGEQLPAAEVPMPDGIFDEAFRAMMANLVGGMSLLGPTDPRVRARGIPAAEALRPDTLNDPVGDALAAAAGSGGPRR